MDIDSLCGVDKMLYEDKRISEEDFTNRIINKCIIAIESYILDEYRCMQDEGYVFEDFDELVRFMNKYNVYSTEDEARIYLIKHEITNAFKQANIKLKNVA